MIYVTGDTHGSMDLGKLHAHNWPEGQGLTRDDYLVVCGDFGAIWDPGDLAGGGGRVLRWWESRPWTTLFVDGNHENHALLDSLAVSERFGAPVHLVSGCPHVIHLMRGFVYDLPWSEGETVRCLVMGGASSVDRMWRVEGVSWWPREMPSEEEYRRCAESLEKVGWSVDYVLTHEVPYLALVDALGWNFATMGPKPQMNELTGFLQWVDDGLKEDSLRMWYAGHHHVDRMVLDDRHRVLYQDVVPMDGAVRNVQPHDLVAQ